MSTIVVILGNVYFYTMRGPIQNMEAIEALVKSYIFNAVLSADLMVDTFFWLSAFLASYQLLTSMQVNDGHLPYSKKLLVFNRYIRLIPIYFITLLIFWRFIVLFGGDGPLFFGYSSMSKCDDNWIWHILMVNNLIPWNSTDGCMNWTWYIACEFQFFLLVPWLVEQYYMRRKKFWYIIASLWATCSVISLIVIFKNDLSASYFTY